MTERFEHITFIAYVLCERFNVDYPEDIEVFKMESFMICKLRDMLAEYAEDSETEHPAEAVLTELENIYHEQHKRNKETVENP